MSLIKASDETVQVKIYCNPCNLNWQNLQIFFPIMCESPLILFFRPLNSSHRTTVALLVTCLVSHIRKLALRLLSWRAAVLSCHMRLPSLWVRAATAPGPPLPAATCKPYEELGGEEKIKTAVRISKPLTNAWASKAFKSVSIYIQQ